MMAGFCENGPLDGVSRDIQAFSLSVVAASLSLGFCRNMGHCPPVGYGEEFESPGQRL
jgi:hypothetical protein